MKYNELDRSRSPRITPWLLCGTALLSLVTSTGCQVTEGGQLLPSPYYLSDDVQYFAPGPEFILSEEANRLKAARADNEEQRR